MSNPFPGVVELELRIDHMRQTMKQAVFDHFGDVQRMIVASIEEQLKPEHVMALVAEHVKVEIDKAIQNAVQSALRYSMSDSIREGVASCASRAAHDFLLELRKQNEKTSHG